MGAGGEAVTEVPRAVADPDAVLERVRSICLGYPGTSEKLSHGANSFFVRGKMFLTFVDDPHRDGNLAVWCKSSFDEQRRLVSADPDQFFVPPYVGVKGWVGVAPRSSEHGLDRARDPDRRRMARERAEKPPCKVTARPVAAFGSA